MSRRVRRVFPLHPPVAFCADGAAGPPGPPDFPRRRRPCLSDPDVDVDNDDEDEDEDEDDEEPRPTPAWRLPSPVSADTAVYDYLLAHPQPLIHALGAVLDHPQAAIAMPYDRTVGTPDYCRLLDVAARQELASRSEMILGAAPGPVLMNGMVHYSIVGDRLPPAAQQRIPDEECPTWESAVDLPLTREIVRVRRPVRDHRPQRIVRLHHAGRPVALVREVSLLPATAHPLDAP